MGGAGSLASCDLPSPKSGVAIADESEFLLIRGKGSGVHEKLCIIATHRWKDPWPKALAARRDRKTPRIAGMGPIPSPVGWLGASKISSLTWWRVTWPIPIAFQTRGSPMVSEQRLATRGQSFPSLETRPVSCTFVRYSDPDVLSWEDLLS